MSQEQPKTIPVERKRGRETALDMLRSMGVLAIFVAFILVITWRPLPSSDPIKPVDAVAIATGSQSRAGFPLIVMAAPEGWTPTSARLEKAPADETKHVWHVGYVTNTNHYFEVEQTDTLLLDKFIESYTGGAKASDSIKSGAVTWEVYSVTDAAVFVYRGSEYAIVVRADDKADSALGLVALEKSVSAV
ncbi:MAG: hypothetical protein RIQ44_833 [Actinomycetota bacterium]|jgi:hypothetical protein